MMRRGSVVVGALALAMLVIGPAWAKGPTAASIVGPGIEKPIVIEGSGERYTGGDFSAFVEAAGFWHLVAGVDDSPRDTGAVVAASASTLGTRYTLSWQLGDDWVDTDLYPFAEGGPVLHLAAQRIDAFDNQAPERWFAADASVLTMLEGYGVPLQPAPAAAPIPESPVAPVEAPAPADRSEVMPWAILAAGALVAVAGAAALAGRRRTGAA